MKHTLQVNRLRYLLAVLTAALLGAFSSASVNAQCDLTISCFSTVNVSLDATGTAVIPPEVVGSVSSAGCDSLFLELSPSTFTCENVNSTVRVTLTVTDGSGNTNSCFSDLIIEDKLGACPPGPCSPDLQAPAVSCYSAVNIALGPGGIAELPVEALFRGAIDNCDTDIEASLSRSTFTCDDIGDDSLFVEVTAVDNNGNTNSCFSQVIVEDKLNVCPPAFFLPDFLLSGFFHIDIPDFLLRGIELKAIADIEDLSCYSIGTANDGDESGGPEYKFPAVSLKEGEFFYLASDADLFEKFFNLQADQESPNFDADGNDAVELYKNEKLIDVFGEPGIDGANSPWFYGNGWAYRKGNSEPFDPMFVQQDWDIQPAVWDGAISNITAPVPFPNGQFDFVPELCLNDNIPPDAKCGRPTLSLGITGQVRLTPDIIDRGSIDFCGLVTLSLDRDYVFDCDDRLDSLFYTLTVTDNNGNTSTCRDFVLVEDVLGVCDGSISGVVAQLEEYIYDFAQDQTIYRWGISSFNTRRPVSAVTFIKPRFSEAVSPEHRSTVKIEGNANTYRVLNRRWSWLTYLVRGRKARSLDRETFEYILPGKPLPKVRAIVFAGRSTEVFDVQLFDNKNMNVDETIPSRVEAPLAKTADALDEDVLVVSPNPAKDICVVQYSLSDGIAKDVELYDLSGQLVLSRELYPAAVDQVELSVGSIPNGIYILRLNTTGQWLTSKIVVQR